MCYKKQEEVFKFDDAPLLLNYYRAVFPEIKYLDKAFFTIGNDSVRTITGTLEGIKIRGLLAFMFYKINNEHVFFVDQTNNVYLAKMRTENSLPIYSRNDLYNILKNTEIIL